LHAAVWARCDACMGGPPSTCDGTCEARVSDPRRRAPAAPVLVDVADELIVEECVWHGPDAPAILGLLKTAKATVGFLTDEAVRGRAQRGTLLAARSGSRIVGNVLYDLPRNEARIVQLVVAVDSRRGGVATALMAAVAERHQARQGIRLDCRRDYPASKLWPKLDFVPVGERVGRSLAGKRITVWRLDFGHPDLFTVLAEEDVRPVAVLDLNLVIDLADGVGPLA
jgi:ribosomal protein S18 acetylase RimI-like enzyme